MPVTPKLKVVVLVLPADEFGPDEDEEADPQAAATIPTTIASATTPIRCLYCITARTIHPWDDEELRPHTA
jgi:hypothetical protein